MNLIQEYVELTKVCFSTDYADKKSVRNHNRSVKRMYEIVEKIGFEQSTIAINDFIKLLDIDNNKTNIWAAVHILERIPVDKTVEQKALSIITQVIDGNSVDSIGFKVWLDNYRKDKTTNR